MTTATLARPPQVGNREVLAPEPALDDRQRVPGWRGRGSAASQILRRPGARAAVTVLGLVAVAGFAWWRLPSPAQLLPAVRSATVGWLVLATLAQVVSMGAFARQQRQLLAAFGVTMSLPRAVALTYSRSALSISLPAGAAVSAGYAFHEFRASGANRRTAATVTVLSGAVSALALVLLYVIGVVATLGAAVRSFALVGVGVLVVAVAALRITRSRPSWVRSVPDRWAAIGARWPRIAATARPVVDAGYATRSLPVLRLGLALAFAAVNWLADLACLVACARALHLSVAVTQIAGVYLVVQVVRQIPITPGGIGVIEVSLLAGLVAGGATAAAASAAVLAYRLLSCWLIIPAGWLAWALLRRSASRYEVNQVRSSSRGTSGSASLARSTERPA